MVAWSYPRSGRACILRGMAGELDGLADAYRAPVADLDDNQGRAAAGRGETDYVVSPAKLVLLFTATLGLYSAYWFYKHWQHQKLAGATSISPIARAIFSVFYAASMFKQLDVDARSLGHAPTWNPTTHAVIFIVVNVAGRVLDKLGGLGEGNLALSVLALLVPLVGVFPLLTAQQIVNLSVGDPQGSSNAQLGGGGIVVLVVGAAVWALMALGLFASA